jgi:anthranilate synthase component 1
MTSLPEVDGGFAAFSARAAGGGLVPVWREVLLDTVTPVSAYHALRRPPFSFLLESAPAGSETWSRFTFLGTSPSAAWRLRDGTVEDWSPAKGWHGARTPADPLADLDQLVSAHTPVDVPGLGDFWGGAVGFLSYDVVRYIEHLPSPPPKANGMPDALFIVPGVVVILDNLRGGARLVAGVPTAPDTPLDVLRAAYAVAVADIEDAVKRLTAGPVPPALAFDPAAPLPVGTSSLSQEAFEAAVVRIKEYILAGDVFQALLARRIEVPHDFDTLTLYRALRAINPSPYMYCLELEEMAIVGSSPELLVRVAEGEVTVRPIAGTRPRGATPVEDQAMSEELSADPKERAEHVMLVDLGRNDVGRVAQYGSVAVPSFMTVEKYSHVLHLVSEVTGRLNEGLRAIDAFRAVFPAGTMTGAPKVRAMQIIDEMEPVRRGPYAGAIGYLAAGGGRMDLAITIRTCVIAEGKASVTTGAGIVADSVPALEWAETENKARAVLTAIARARRVAGR